MSSRGLPRTGEPIAGVRSLRAVAEIPEPIDLAVICLPGEHVLDAAAEALQAGVRALCVISAGFAEIGAEGMARQNPVLALPDGCVAVDARIRIELRALSAPRNVVNVAGNP